MITYCFSVIPISVLFADFECVFISILNAVKRENLILNKQILENKRPFTCQGKQFDLSKWGKTENIVDFRNFPVATLTYLLDDRVFKTVNIYRY